MHTKIERFLFWQKQTISHPSTVAEQNRTLEVNEKEKILEIGTGSGYQTAVLVAMNAFVYTIERQKELHDFCSKTTRTTSSSKISKFWRRFCGLPTLRL